MNNQAVTEHDEINLFDIFSFFWKNKYLILCSILLCGSLATTSVLLTKRVYVAHALILPPTASDVIAFNYWSSPLVAEANAYSPNSVFDLFTQNLTSEATKRHFFNTSYLPSLPEQKRHHTSIDTLYEEFNKQLSVDKRDAQKLVLTYKNGDAVSATQFIKAYIAFSNQEVLTRIISLIKTENNLKLQRLKNRIDLIKNTAEAKKRDRLTQLQEASHMAEVVSADKQEILHQRWLMIDIHNLLNEPSFMYLRGKKVLESEIKNLSTRSTDDSFSPGLRELENEYKAYQSIQINPKNVRIYKLDGSILTPDRPISRNGILIVFMSMMLGLTLGTLLAFVRQFWQNMDSEKINTGHGYPESILNA